MERHQAVDEFKRQYSQIWRSSDLQEIRFAWDIWKEDAFRDGRITMRQKICWECPAHNICTV